MKPIFNEISMKSYITSNILSTNYETASLKTLFIHARIVTENIIRFKGSL